MSYPARITAQRYDAIMNGIHQLAAEHRISLDTLGKMVRIASAQRNACKVCGKVSEGCEFARCGMRR